MELIQKKGIRAYIKKKTIPEVVEELFTSADVAHVRVAKLLKEKYL